ncbi:winged helix-turn-helix domain-containing protein [Streptomyces sp. RKAG290]|uniref:helix-turn-helix domain-containing protein n=1 Tax=Streptomyces sp. RKAG290 TaxID=2888348 RepID=UPI002034779C|nr:winged helix-turn-helix domain-containing protein [Streptomyces sp. RKAG290]MCM2413835.1 winged helix-turn-helix domain-containing protein [Streptomyces sp. RKAG290]
MAENEAGRDSAPAGTPELHMVNARTLRGLAHPLRLRLLNTLREFGPATASGLADRLGESSGATSYHLRQLASYGFVADDPERGKGRERWWKAVHTGTAFDRTADFLRDPDPEVRGAMGVVMHEIATTHTQELNTWLGTMHEWPEEWLRSSDLSDFKVRLTPELSLELAEKIHELVESYRDRVPEDTEGSAVVRTHLHVFPRPTD